MGEVCACAGIAPRGLACKAQTWAGVRVAVTASCQTSRGIIRDVEDEGAGDGWTRLSIANLSEPATWRVRRCDWLASAAGRPFRGADVRVAFLTSYAYDAAFAARLAFDHVRCWLGHFMDFLPSSSSYWVPRIYVRIHGHKCTDVLDSLPAQRGLAWERFV